MVYIRVLILLLSLYVDGSKANTRAYSINHLQLRRATIFTIEAVRMLISYHSLNSGLRRLKFPSRSFELRGRFPSHRLEIRNDVIINRCITSH